MYPRPTSLHSGRGYSYLSTLSRYAHLFLCALLISLSLHISFSAKPAFSADIDNRLERLERDLRFVQREVYNRDKTSRSDNTSSQAQSSNASAGDTAALQASIERVEEQMRRLQGQIEELQHAQDKQQKAFSLFERDIEQRLQAAPANNGAPVMAPVIGDEASIEAPVLDVSNAANAAPTQSAPIIAPTIPEKTTVIEDVKAVTADIEAPQEVEGFERYSNPRAHYNAAIALLKNNAYDDAEAHFSDFITRYPKDALLGNAHYWLGESFYVRDRHAAAANEFRKGFETMPEGPKASDNLLKLALSLEQLEKPSEACVVLTQLVTRHSDAGTVHDKAAKEITRLEC